MTELLEKVTDLFGRRRQEKARTFDELVKAAASDKPPTPATIAETLEELGRTPGDLAAALDYRQRRSAMRAKLDGVPRLETELADVQRTFQAEMVRWEPVEKSHKSTVLRCEAEASRLETAIAEAKATQARLRATYQGPLTEELQSVEAERADLFRQTEAVRNTRGQAEQSLSGPRRFGTTLTEHDRATYTGIVSHCDGEVSKLQTAIANLDKRASEIEEAMVEP